MEYRGKCVFIFLSREKEKRVQRRTYTYCASNFLSQEMKRVQGKAHKYVLCVHLSSSQEKEKHVQEEHTRAVRSTFCHQEMKMGKGESIQVKGKA